MFPQSKWKHLIILYFNHPHVWKLGRHFLKTKRNQCIEVRNGAPSFQELWVHTTFKVLGLLHHLEMELSFQVLDNEFMGNILWHTVYPQSTLPSSLICITWPNFPSGYSYSYSWHHHPPKAKGSGMGAALTSFPSPSPSHHINSPIHKLPRLWADTVESSQMCCVALCPSPSLCLPGFQCFVPRPSAKLPWDY